MAIVAVAKQLASELLGLTFNSPLPFFEDDHGFDQSETGRALPRIPTSIQNSEIRKSSSPPDFRILDRGGDARQRSPRFALVESVIVFKVCPGFVFGWFISIFLSTLLRSK
jgi:hypothetical protein